MMNKKSDMQRRVEADLREQRKEDGYFDGRYKEKVIPNKKKYNRRRDKKDFGE